MSTKLLPGRKKFARGKGRANPVDVHVGNRLRTRRSVLNISQEDLASAVGITFQQIQKYERGANRVSASKLYDFSKVLQVPIAYFFENFSETQFGGQIANGLKFGLADNDQEAFLSSDKMADRETTELIRCYYAIRDPKLRKDIIRMMKTMAETGPSSK